jgi:hypothetical protein
MSTRRSPRPGTTASFLAVAALLGSGLLAGCSGSGSEEPTSETSADATESGGSAGTTESAGAEETPATEGATEGATDESDDTAEATDVADELPLPKAPKARNTPDGRKAFTEFVIQRWGYALTTNDAGAMSDLSARGSTCQGCKELEKELAQRRKEGWNVDFPGAAVDRITVKPAGAPATYEATAVIDIPASRSYFEDGTYRNENEAFKNAKFIAAMKYTKARYTLVSFRVA